MKLVFKSKRVSVAILIGEDPFVEEPAEEHVSVGGSFEPVTPCEDEDCDCVRPPEVFGFSPVRV